MQILQRFSVTLSLVIIAWLFCKLLIFKYKVTKTTRLPTFIRTFLTRTHVKRCEFHHGMQGKKNISVVRLSHSIHTTETLLYFSIFGGEAMNGDSAYRLYRHRRRRLTDSNLVPATQTRCHRASQAGVRTRAS